MLVRTELPYSDIALVANPDNQRLPVDHAVICDAPIDEAAAYMPRTIGVVRMSVSLSQDRKTFHFRWQPPLQWQKCIYVQVFSRQKIHILAIMSIGKE